MRIALAWGVMHLGGLLCRGVLCLGVLCLVGVLGCGRQDEITRYSVAVAHGPEGLEPAAGELEPGGSPGAASKRMLAAIIPRGKRTWFFKLTGPDEAVGAQRDPFIGLLKTVRFVAETGQPTWDLPGGWRQQGATGMRFATIEIPDGEQTLELTVIPLDTRGDLDDYVRDNINRWRGQLGLPPMSDIEAAPGYGADGEPNGVRQFQIADSIAVTMVNLQGRGEDPAVPSGFDMSQHPPIGDALFSGLPAATTDGIALSYDTPEGWSAGKVGGMRRAAWEVREGEQKVEITVISLPKSGGERLANINRWRAQIQLDETTAEQLAEDLRPLPVAETSGDYVELIGPADAAPREAILAVLVDVGENTWFLKLKGDVELAQRERQRFQTFARSLRFSTTAKAPDASPEDSENASPEDSVGDARDQVPPETQDK